MMTPRLSGWADRWHLYVILGSTLSLAAQSLILSPGLTSGAKEKWPHKRWWLSCPRILRSSMDRHSAHAISQGWHFRWRGHVTPASLTVGGNFSFVILLKKFIDVFHLIKKQQAKQLWEQTSQTFITGEASSITPIGKAVTLFIKIHRSIMHPFVRLRCQGFCLQLRN